MGDSPLIRHERRRRPPPDAGSSGSSEQDEASSKHRGGSATNEALRQSGSPLASEHSTFSQASIIPEAPFHVPFHPSIEMDTGVKVVDVPNWLAHHAASDAAVGKSYVGRMIGKFTMEVTCTKAVRKKLLKANKVRLIHMKKGTRFPFLKRWNTNGEFPSGEGEHVPVSRLVEALASAEAVCTPPEGLAVVKYLAELQSPTASPWKRPLVRALSSHQATAAGMRLTYYVYTSRLFFELIADPAISGLMRGLEPIAKVTPPAQLQDQPVEFVSARPAASTTASGRDYEFSLAGILKAAESTGYRVVDDPPDDLTVNLFNYQRSTCQWMLDHERDPSGLNGYFWEKREWADGGDPLWYFPLAGEFRLAAPPHITGGLLCEEMGLGKTVEVLSTILSNPRQNGNAETSPAELRDSLRSGEACNYDSQGRVISRATLLVVPVSLVGQWAQEIRKNVKPGTLRVMTFEGSVERDVPLSRVNVPGLASTSRSRSRRGSVQRRSCSAPYFAPGENARNSEGWMRKGMVNLSPEQYRRITASQGGGNADEGRDAGSGSGSGSDGGEEVEMVKVEFKPDELLLADNDVLLTTYEVLRSKQALFRKLSFHRCVLDECQEIKTATTNIAKMCREVHATHRWMVSGTPLSSSINDLHGELNFLQVWPFSLQKDGFWEKKIAQPFAAKDADALKLLRALIDVVMMRHSKSQRDVDGRPILRIPARTVEWRGVDFVTPPESGSNANAPAPHACYVYQYLERLCVSVCRRVQQNDMGRREFSKIKCLLTLLQMAATHPGLLSLGQLDTLKRSVDGQNLTPAQQKEALEKALKSQADAIELLPAEEVLRRLAQKGDVNRHWAVGGEEEMKLRDRLERLPLLGLQQRWSREDGELEEEGLPVPRSWAVLKHQADIYTGSCTLDFGAGTAMDVEEDKGETEEADDDADTRDEKAGGGGSSSSSSSSCTQSNGKRKTAGAGKSKGKEIMKGRAEGESEGESEDEGIGGGRGKGKGKGKRRMPAPLAGSLDVRKFLKVSDTVRVGLNREDNEATVKAVEERSATLATKWVPGPVKSGRVYRFSISSRRKPFVDLLVTMNKTKSGGEVHTAGFSSIYKAMAGEPVSCPICMCSIERPTVTKCAHLFCRQCIVTELQKGPVSGKSHSAKCPICRRAMKGIEMMELEPLSEVEEAVSFDSNGLETTATGDGSGGGENAGDGAAREAQPGEVDAGGKTFAAPGCDRPSPSSSAGAGASAGTAGSMNCPSQGARSGVDRGEGRDVLAMGEDCDQMEEDAAETNLVIPMFEMTPTATASQLSSTPMPQLAPGERDPMFPSLETAFLRHFRASSNPPSSVKLDAMLTDMQETLGRDPSSKFVIFSQYSKVVERVGRLLTDHGIQSTSVMGGRTRAERNSAVTSFVEDPAIQAIVMTTGAGSAGLSLTPASTVYMLEPVWSAADEAQALNRAHRIGQNRAVRCVVFYMKDSVEERLLALRQAKGNFAQFLEDRGSILTASSAAFEGGSFVNVYALTELKRLFGMVEVDDEQSSVSSHSQSSGLVSDDYLTSDDFSDASGVRSVEMEDETEGNEESRENPEGARGAMSPSWRAIFQTESAPGGGASSPVDLT